MDSGRDLREMLAPDPPDLVGPIVLVPGEVTIATEGEDVEDLARSICQVRVARFQPGRVDSKFVDAGDKEHDVQLTRTGSLCRCLGAWRVGHW